MSERQLIGIVIPTAKFFAVAGLMLMVFFVLLSYPAYLIDTGQEQACESEFGDESIVIQNAESGNHVVCSDDDSLKVTKYERAHVSAETFSQYLVEVWRHQ